MLISKPKVDEWIDGLLFTSLLISVLMNVSWTPKALQEGPKIPEKHPKDG